jgi:hypothetical protein
MAAAVFPPRPGTRRSRRPRWSHRLLEPSSGSTLAPALFGLSLICAGHELDDHGTLAGRSSWKGSSHPAAPWLRRLVTRGIANIPAVIKHRAAPRGSTGQLLSQQVLLSMQLSFRVIPPHPHGERTTRSTWGRSPSGRGTSDLPGLRCGHIAVLNVKLGRRDRGGSAGPDRGNGRAVRRESPPAAVGALHLFHRRRAVPVRARRKSPRDVTNRGRQVEPLRPSARSRRRSFSGIRRRRPLHGRIGAARTGARCCWSTASRAGARRWGGRSRTRRHEGHERLQKYTSSWQARHPVEVELASGALRAIPTRPKRGADLWWSGHTATRGSPTGSTVDDHELTKNRWTISVLVGGPHPLTLPFPASAPPGKKNFLTAFLHVGI